MTYQQEIIKVPRFEEVNGFYTTSERSKLMAKIKGKNTKPEIAFRKMLWNAGIRYRKHFKGMPGNPDIIIKKYKLVVFIDGEFWHGFNWDLKKGKIKTNRDFWIPKIERNMQRDLENNAKFQALGYKVFRFWEHEIKKEPQTCIAAIIQYISTLNK